MPYKSISELPEAVRNALPKHAQEIYMGAFNAAFERYKQEVNSARIAWAAVKRKYKKSGDQWIAKAVDMNDIEGQIFKRWYEKAAKITITIDDGKVEHTENVQHDDVIPREIRKLPVGAQKIWREGFDSAMSLFGNPYEAWNLAWSKVNRDYYHIEGEVTGSYIKKPRIEWQTVVGESFNIEKATMDFVEKAANTELVIKRVPIAHVGMNGNNLIFTDDELANSYTTWDGRPVKGDLGRTGDDHNLSSFSDVGWANNPIYAKDHEGVGTVYYDLHITNPETIEKLRRKDSEGRREINFVSMAARNIPVCTICGEDQRRCPHERGQIYDGKECEAISTQTFGHHIALTNDPADIGCELPGTSHTNFIP